MTYYMPAEWALHDWVWIGFPGNEKEWSATLPDAQRQIAAFADAVHAGGKGEEVRLVAADDANAAIARALVGVGVVVQVERHGDVWLRDTGSICVTNGGARALVDFGFNGWGGKYVMAGDED
ncbi:MAG: agmatine deiminase family protein, partial [Sphingobium sp.]